MFKISKGKLKKVDNNRPWHEYLKDKILILGEIFNQYRLLAIEGEKNLEGLCRYAWATEPDSEHEYETLEDFIEDVELGNMGYGFDIEEIQEVKIIFHEFNIGESDEK